MERIGYTQVIDIKTFNQHGDEWQDRCWDEFYQQQISVNAMRLMSTLSFLRWSPSKGHEVPCRIEDAELAVFTIEGVVGRV